MMVQLLGILFSTLGLHAMSRTVALVLLEAPIALVLMLVIMVLPIGIMEHKHGVTVVSDLVLPMPLVNQTVFVTILASIHHGIPPKRIGTHVQLFHVVLVLLVNRIVHVTWWVIVEQRTTIQLLEFGAIAISNRVILRPPVNLIVSVLQLGKKLHGVI
jgi:hypothetical protein